MDPIPPATDKYLTEEDKCMFMKLYCCRETTYGVERDNVHLKELAFELLPNPVNSSSVNLTLSGPNMGSDELHVRIMDALGALVSESIIGKGEQQIMIDVSGLASGMYFVIVRSEKGSFGRKLIVGR
jgi:hypothetical protein